MEMVSRLQAAQYGESFFHSLDPRVKMGLALIFSLIGPLIENQLMLGILTITAMSYLLLAGQRRVLLFIGAFFVISMVMYLFIEALILSRPPKFMEYLTLTLTMLPIMCIGLLLGMTTSIEKLVTALGKLGMPTGMRYAVMVAMRYVAMLGREMRHVVQAMKVRGVMVGWKDPFTHPVSTMRIILIPLLIRSFKVADRMGAAAELRGLSAPDNELQLAELSMKSEDWIFLVTNLALVGGLWLISNSVM
jgi:energy-coupling factor transport system permease protein